MTRSYSLLSYSRSLFKLLTLVQLENPLTSHRRLISPLKLSGGIRVKREIRVEKTTPLTNAIINSPLGLADLSYRLCRTRQQRQEQRLATRTYKNKNINDCKIHLPKQLEDSKKPKSKVVTFLWYYVVMKPGLQQLARLLSLTGTDRRSKILAR